MVVDLNYQVNYREDKEREIRLTHKLEKEGGNPAHTHTLLPRNHYAHKNDLRFIRTLVSNYSRGRGHADTRHATLNL